MPGSAQAVGEAGRFAFGRGSELASPSAGVRFRAQWRDLGDPRHRLRRMARAHLARRGPPVVGGAARRWMAHRVARLAAARGDPWVSGPLPPIERGAGVVAARPLDALRALPGDPFAASFSGPPHGSRHRPRILLRVAGRLGVHGPAPPRGAPRQPDSCRKAVRRAGPRCRAILAREGAPSAARRPRARRRLGTARGGSGARSRLDGGGCASCRSSPTSQCSLGRASR